MAPKPSSSSNSRATSSDSLRSDRTTDSTIQGFDSPIRLAPEPRDSRWIPGTLPDDDEDDEPRWTELQIVSRNGDVGRVTQILSQCKDAAQRREVVNAPAVGWYGQTALQAACFHEHEEVVKVLLSAGADISAPGGNNIYQNAFEYACGTGNLPIIRLLLNSGAVDCVNRPKVTRYQGRTPIQAAAEGGHEEVVNLLLDLGADINAPSSPAAGCTALQAASFQGHASLVKLLVAKGADVNAPGAKNLGFTALQGASRAGEREVVEILVQSGANVNAPAPSNHQGGTALHAAAAGGHIDIVKKLLVAGANPNSQAGPRSQTPAQSAYLTGRRDVVDMLIEAGAVGPLTGGKLLFSNMRSRTWSRSSLDSGS